MEAACRDYLERLGFPDTPLLDGLFAHVGTNEVEEEQGEEDLGGSNLTD